MHEDELPRVLMQVLDSFTDDLRKLHGLLVDVIDFQESKRQRRLVVLEGIDLDLDKEKRAYEGLGDFLEVLQVRAQNTRNERDPAGLLAFLVSMSPRDTDRDTFSDVCLYIHT